jgi:DNA-binding transcriptional regulator YhcF (GntR family)
MAANATRADDAGVRIHLDASSKTPLSRQLRDGLVARIERGALQPAERLPPVRELAEDLDLAPNTVAKAYRELEAAGYLVTRGRHGTFVAERLQLRPHTSSETALEEAARRFAGRARQLGVDEVEALRAARRAFHR